MNKEMLCTIEGEIILLLR